MRAQLQTYKFLIDQPGQLKAYQDLLKTIPTKECFNVRATTREDSYPYNQIIDIEIDTNHLFDNQFNTVDGKRLFDWFEGIYPNKNFKSGHFLIDPTELNNLRSTRLACGYCGKQYENHNDTVCLSCVSSEYLTPEYYHLLALKPVNFKGDRKLSNDDLNRILPLIESAKIARLQKKKLDLIARKEKEMKQKEIELKGFTFFLDHNIDIDNLIYYSHKNQFCFGWRNKLSDDEASKILDVISEFQYPYIIKSVSKEFEGY